MTLREFWVYAHRRRDDRCWWCGDPIEARDLCLPCVRAPDPGCFTYAEDRVLLWGVDYAATWGGP